MENNTSRPARFITSQLSNSAWEAFHWEMNSRWLLIKMRMPSWTPHGVLAFDTMTFPLGMALVSRREDTAASFTIRIEVNTSFLLKWASF